MQHFPRFYLQPHAPETSRDFFDGTHPLTSIGCEKDTEKSMEILQKACDDGFGASCAVLRQRAAQLAKQSTSAQSEKE